MEATPLLDAARRTSLCSRAVSETPHMPPEEEVVVVEDVVVVDDAADDGGGGRVSGMLWDHPFDAVLRTIAEFIGCFIFFFIGIGAGISVGIAGEQGLLLVALANGLVLAIVVSALGHISGGHFNPAVTIGFLVTRRIAPLLALMYIVAQCVAGIAAAGMVRWLYPGTTGEAAGYGAPALDPRLSTGEGLVLEALLTSFLVFVVFATAADIRGAFKSIAGLAIGLTVAVDVMVGGPLTGAMMNPARAFGSHVIDNTWTDAWIWYVGPILGGAIAALLYELLYLRPLRPAPVGVPESGVDEPRPGDAALS
jgi:aquaporin Z